MSTEKMLEAVNTVLKRRRFLRNLGASGLGAVLAMMGLARPALAHGVHVYCCHLCYTPGGCGSTGCEWCWTCCTNDGQKYRCCERFQVGSHTCNGNDLNNCPYVACSTTTFLGSCPFGPASAAPTSPA